MFEKAVIILYKHSKDFLFSHPALYENLNLSFITNIAPVCVDFYVLSLKENLLGRMDQIGAHCRSILSNWFP